jgi:predicted Zn-dependent protease
MMRFSLRAPLARVFAVAALVPATLGSLSRAPSAAPVQQNEHTIGSIVDSYRAGNVGRALDRLSTLVAEPRSEDATLAWIRAARQAGRQADLEAALMVYSEAIMGIWLRNDVYPYGPAAPYIPQLIRVRQALTVIDLRSPFLRDWYLLWESFRQAYDHMPLPDTLDFLDEALSAFRDDAATQFAAGTRHELTWWHADDNSRRDPRGSSSMTKRALIEARDRYRRSLGLDPRADETRLHLLRVLLELDEPEAAEKLLAGVEWSGENPAVLYLARLFEGSLRERQGDHTAAARLYDLAIAQTPQAQSARIAKAQLAYAAGSRADAAVLVLDAMSSTSAADDPWWSYSAGLVWHFDAYLARQRAVVRR